MTFILKNYGQGKFEIGENGNCVLLPAEDLKDKSWEGSLVEHQQEPRDDDQTAYESGNIGLLRT